MDKVKGFSVQQMPKAFLMMVLLTVVLTSLMVLGISPDAWSESTLIHNSNRFGTCSNAAFSGTSKTICETNGGVWTPSTKWSGSWGVPAGQYGEFVCETCHERGSDNIKNIISQVTAPSGSFPGNTINFLSTTAPSGFGDDTGGHTTSNKICEVCHSTTSYHRYDTTAQSTFNHYNKSDCVVCHTHGRGFRPGCDSCHGNPPIASVPNASSPGGNTGLADNPYATGSHYAGAHNKHVNNFGFSNCSICHNGYTMPSSVSTYTIDINFSFNGSTSGTYDGQTGVRYNAPNTATGSMTCSNVYCHSNGTGGTSNTAPEGIPPLGDPRPVATRTSPAWSASGPLACNSCHGYPPSYSQDHPKSNSHMYGQFAGDAHRQPCNICHYATTTDGVTITNPSNHANGIYNVQPDPTASVYGPVNFTYAYDAGGGKCANNSCHGGPIPWGRVSILAPIITNYGPACYQVQMFPNFSGGTAPFACNWDLGDGTTSSDCSADHLYASTGPFTVTVSGRDANAHPYSATQSITPEAINIPPTVDQTVSVACFTVTLTDLSIDPDYNTCGHAGSAQEAVNWGDGSTSSANVNLTNSPSNHVFTKTYATASTYNITHTVKDNASATVATLISSVKVPSTHTISGRVTHTGGAPFPGIPMLLRQGGTTRKTTTTDANGDYSFTAVNCGSYQVVANRSGYTWSPSQTVNVTVPPDQTVNFVATP